MALINTHRLQLISGVSCSLYSLTTMAAGTAAPSATASLGRMVLGTLVVLLVIGGVAWLARRVLPGQGSGQQGVIRQVGGLHLGPRERVVVLEVAGRWLVVGVHGGQMTALGDMPVATLSADPLPAAQSEHPIDPDASFATRLQQAMQQTVQTSLKSLKSKP